MSDYVEQLQKVLEGVNDKLKDPSLFTTGNQKNWSNVQTWISTGSTLMDIVMTSYDADFKPLGSGWACGRWYEIFGEEAGGKSTILGHAFKETQAVDGIPGLIDSESKLDKPRLQRMGVDLSRLVLCDAPYLERGIESFEMMMEALRKNPTLRERPVLYGWDTIASVDTKADYEGGQYAGGQAGKARQTRQMFRDLTNKLPEYNACFILINQVSDTMGGRYEKQTDTTGGRGAKYHSSARLEVQKYGVYTDPENREIPMGINARIKFVKSSMFRPFAEVELPINFFYGIDDTLSLINFHATHSKIITNAGGVYKCPDYFGKDAAGKRLAGLLAHAKEDELFLDYLKSKARENASLLWKKAASYAAPKDEK